MKVLKRDKLATVVYIYNHDGDCLELPRDGNFGCWTCPLNNCIGNAMLRKKEAKEYLLSNCSKKELFELLL